MWLEVIKDSVTRYQKEFSKRRQATPENSHRQVFPLKTLETFEIDFHPGMHHKVFLVPSHYHLS